MKPADCIVVVTTCADEEEAERLATALVDRRLAACVQTSAIKSTYRWKGSVESAVELRLLIKARSADYDEIEALIRIMHSYQNPEILAFPATAASQQYLDWLEAETIH